MLSSKFSKNSKMNKDTMIYKIKEKGMEVINCGLGVNTSIGEGGFCSRTGVFGHLNFYPRWVGGLEKDTDDNVKLRPNDLKDFDDSESNLNDSE
jgi:hypothetical protein